MAFKCKSSAHSGKFFRSFGIAAFAAALIGATAFADPVDWSAYERSFNITFPGYTGSETLENFPVLIRLSAERNDFRYNKCKIANGGDLRFSDAEGNLLPSEIDTWDESGESLVWVRVPSLTATTMIKAYYGCSSPAEMNPKDVWSGGYVGVWHMDEDSRSQTDSTVNNKTLSGHATYSANMVFGAEGSVGKAVELSTTEDTHGGGFEASDSGSLYTGTKTLTVEIWARHRKIANDKYIFRLKNAQSKNSFAARFSWPVYGGDYTKTQINYSSILTNLTAGTGNEYGDVKYQIPTNEIVNAWRHYAFVIDNETLHRLEAFQNGVSIKTQSIADEEQTIWAGKGTLLIGNTSSSQEQAFPGTLDEVRISRIARSSEWIKATYDTITDKDFAVYEAPNDWESYTHTFKVTFPGAPATALTDFPVLVKVSANDIAGFSYTDCRKPNGGDLRFSDESGQLLAHEIDTWDENGVSTVWVKVPTLSSTTTIIAHYGWKFAPHVNPKEVWSNGYVGVWHLGESARPLCDSSSTGIDFTSSYDASRPNYLDECNGYGEGGGAVGNALRVGVPSSNSGKNGRGGLLAYDPEAKIGGFSAMTAEIWAKPNDWDSWGTASDRYLFSKRLQNNPKTPVFYTYYAKTTVRPYMYFGIDANKDGTTTGFGSYGSSSSNSMTNQIAEQWYYHVIRFDRTASNSMVAFLNGSNHYGRSGQIDYDIISYADPLCLGNNPNANQTNVFLGCLDEFRISNVARSSAWIKATYDTIKNNATFTTYGSARENIKGFLLLIR